MSVCRQDTSDNIFLSSLFIYFFSTNIIPFHYSLPPFLLFSHGIFFFFKHALINKCGSRNIQHNKIIRRKALDSRSKHLSSQDSYSYNTYYVIVKLLKKFHIYLVQTCLACPRLLPKTQYLYWGVGNLLQMNHKNRTFANGNFHCFFNFKVFYLMWLQNEL